MIKTSFDFVLAVLISILLIPFWFVLLLVPSLSIFKQVRIGQYGQKFTIYKLQTMVNGKVTKLGSFLRRSKIDELPQLFNILKGDMAFVGPRPDIPGYYDKLTGKHKEILNLKPGLTSLAALKYVNEEMILRSKTYPKQYNDEVIFPDKVQMNLDYCRKRSFRYDLYIIGVTLSTIFAKNNFSK